MSNTKKTECIKIYCQVAKMLQIIINWLKKEVEK